MNIPMRFCLLAFLVISCSAVSQKAQTSTNVIREKVVPVEPIMPPEIPIRISDPKLEILSEELTYGIESQTEQRILRIDGFLYLVSPAGEIKMTAEWTEVNINAYEKRKSEYNYLLLSEEQNEPLERRNPKDRLILTVHEVKTESGTWVIDRNELEAVVRSKAAGKRFRMPKVEREYALRIDERDKADLFRIAFEYLFGDTAMLDYLGIEDKKNIILSTQDLGMFVIPLIRGVNMIQMDPEDIQRTAERDGRVIFFEYSPPRVEGSRVYVGFTSRDRVRKGTMTECWGGEFTFEYRRKSGNWEYLRGFGGRF